VFIDVVGYEPAQMPLQMMEGAAAAAGGYPMDMMDIGPPPPPHAGYAGMGPGDMMGLSGQAQQQQPHHQRMMPAQQQQQQQRMTGQIMGGADMMGPPHDQMSPWFDADM